MVTLLSALGGFIEGIIGPWFKSIAVPAMLLAACYAAVAKHDGKVTALCDAKWESQIRNEEQTKAQAQVGAVTAILENERSQSEGLKNDLGNLQKKLDALHGDDGGSSPMCLSQRVLDALGSREK